MLVKLGQFGWFGRLAVILVSIVLTIMLVGGS